MLLFKTGVKLNGIKPETVVAMTVANEVFALHKLDCKISSVVEGKHSRTSLHYPGFAFDISCDDIFSSEEANSIRFAIDARLTNEYDVVLTWTDSDNDHFHIEFQPKNSH